MKKSCLVMFLLAPLFVYAQPKEKGWRNLFNGKDLSGWTEINGTAKYEVVNGMIVGTTVENTPNSFLAADGVYGDFILELDFKMDDGTNSGIQFRSEATPEYMNGRVHGYQLDIDPTQRKWCGGIYDESRRQWLYPLEYNPPAKNAYKNNQWNKARIEAIGNIMRTWINGIPCANLVDDWTPKGLIALQVHAIGKPEEAGKHVWFKNIRIKTENLEPSPIDHIFVMNLTGNSLTEQEKSNGVRLLWDGNTTQGWRGIFKDKFPEKGWDLQHGELTIKPGASAGDRGGDIITTDEFSFFDLQFEFKLTDGANSGVKYFITENENTKGAAVGPEYQILDDEKHPDAKQGVVGNRTLASLYDLIPADKNPRGIRKIGEWNQGRIIVYPDNRVEHWLNGYKVVEFIRGNGTFKALVARSKFAPYENFGMAEKGHILLQDHGDVVSFRGIKIKDLTK